MFAYRSVRSEGHSSIKGLSKMQGLRLFWLAVRLKHIQTSSDHLSNYTAKGDRATVKNCGCMWFTATHVLKLYSLRLPGLPRNTDMHKHSISSHVKSVIDDWSQMRVFVEPETPAASSFKMGEGDDANPHLVFVCMFVCSPAACVTVKPCPVRSVFLCVWVCTRLHACRT